MKKKIASLFAVLLAVCLSVGCGSEPTMTNRDLNQTKVDKYVALGDYSNLSVAVAPVEVTQQEWEELMLAVYQSYVTKDNGAVTGRAVEMGDTVIIDYVGKRDGVAFEGGTATGASLTIGSGQYIEGFEDGLVGAMPGEAVELNLSFPEVYLNNPDLAGQAVVFDVTVDYILPTLDEMQDSVVASLEVEDVRTVDELWQYVYDYLQESAEETYQYNLQNAIMEALIAQSTIEELPQTFVDSYSHVYSESVNYNASYYGVTPDVFTNYYYGMNSEDFISRNSLLQARQEILLQAIANSEGLTVSDDELQEKLEEYASDGGFGTVDEMIGDYDIEEYRNYIMTEKVMDFLIENANVTEE